MPIPPQPVLILYSHGRSPPLYPAPDLKYDLRCIPNPPKALRAVSDGRSKRLREHLLSETKFVSKLNVVEEEIRNAMAEKLLEYTQRGSGATDSSNVNMEESNTEKEEELSEDLDDEDEQENEDGNEEKGEAGVVLRVGCNCALGHHRSVAFVCELGNRDWPKEWIVEVIHRDIEKKRSGGSREKQKASWKGDRKRSEDNGLDDRD